MIALSLYSLSDFMLYQTSLDMKEDGSCYTDVISTIQYKDIPTAIKALSDENIISDVSYSFQRYMTADFHKNKSILTCRDISLVITKRSFMW